MRAGMALVIGTVALSLLILGVVLKGTQDLGENMQQYQTFQWEEEPEEEDPELHATVAVPDTGLGGEGDEGGTDPGSDDPGTSGDGMDDPATRAGDTADLVGTLGPLDAVASHVLTIGDIEGTLRVDKSGLHTFTLDAPVTEAEAKEALQAWAQQNGRLPFTFKGWTPLEPAT